MEDSKTLVAARELYNEQMVNALTPALIQHINTMEHEARENSTPKTFLKAIQELCRQIPQWNQHILDNEVKRILRQTEPGFLDDLLPAIFVSNAQILSSVSLHGNANKINLKIPKLAMFIHTVYIELARKLFKQVYLFCDNVPQTQKQMNKHIIEQLAKDSVSLAVAKLLPVHDIIKACVLSDAPEDEVSSQNGGDLKDKPVTDDATANGVEQNDPDDDSETKLADEDTSSNPDAQQNSDTPHDGSADADNADHTHDADDKADSLDEHHPEGNTADNPSDNDAGGKENDDNHDTEDLEKSVEPTDVALPDDESISDDSESKVGGIDSEPTEIVKQPDENIVDPNESDEHHEKAEEPHTLDSPPEEIVIDIGLSDDDCIRAKDEDGVLLSYDSDVNATRLQPTPTPFHPKKQAGASDTQKESQTDHSSSEDQHVQDKPAEHQHDKDDHQSTDTEHKRDENAEESQQPETPHGQEADDAPSIKLAGYIASPDATKYQTNDSTDLSDNDMDYNFTDDELFSDDDEVSRIIYDMKAKQTADDRDTVTQKLMTQESSPQVQPTEEPEESSNSKPEPATTSSTMAVFLGDMAPKQVKKALSHKTVSELPIERNKADRRATMTKRFEKRREQQKVDPVIMDYNTESDQDDQSSPPRFSNLPQASKSILKGPVSRKRVTLLPDAASDSD